MILSNLVIQMHLNIFWAPLKIFAPIFRVFLGAQKCIHVYWPAKYISGIEINMACDLPFWGYFYQTRWLKCIKTILGPSGGIWAPFNCILGAPKISGYSLWRNILIKMKQLWHSMTWYYRCDIVQLSYSNAFWYILGPFKVFLHLSLGFLGAQKCIQVY